MKIKKRFGKIMVIPLFFILVTMSATQAVVKINDTSEEGTNLNIIGKDEGLLPIPLSNGPFFTWEDDFNTMEWIDISMSYDFEVVNGFAQIKNTYEVWTDPDWTRLKPITLTNNAGQTLTDYALNLTVEYDPDMQDDYDDIRFKHEDYPNTWLDYYIETKDTSSANVWVNIPEIPTGNSMMYLFYGNPDAEDESDFYSVFSDWDEEWANDEQISYSATKEGAWDPDVAYGVDSDDNGLFFVAWEEGTAYFFPLTVFKQEIRGSIYDTEGNCEEFDFTIFTEKGFYYRNENPSVAFGGGKFFVAFENYINPVNNDYIKRDVKGALVETDGDVEKTFNICTGSDVAADPCVAFDTVNNQFCVVWEDAREGYNNFNIYGKLYDINGTQVGSKNICTEGNSQLEPWVAFDPVNEQYMIVWEEGLTADNGPFSLYAGLFDENLNQIGDTITIVEGDDDTDYNFPCVSFCEETERFLVTWNDGDISEGDWWGNIWGKILDESGDVDVDTFKIKSGNFVRTDIVTYLSSSYFVSYDDEENIWGKLVSFKGDILSDDVQLSASNSAVAFWANMAVGDEKIFVAWEDTRIYHSPPWNDLPDAFGNIWRLNIPSGSQVSSQFGTEKKQILSAQVTSKAVEPEILISWHKFGVDFDGSITFDILDGTGNIVLIKDASDGEDLSGIDPEVYPALRVQGHFTRNNPSYTPTLDKWNITYVGYDEVPPETTIGEIIGEQGEIDWYIGNVKIILNATDGPYGSGINYTYFRIDNGDIHEYDHQVGIRLPQHATGDPNTPHGEWDVWYWSVDKAGNEEPKQGPVHIKIDKVMPHCDIWEPPDRGHVPLEGNFWVKANATDEGSGIHYVLFDVGPPYSNPAKVYDDDPPGSGNYKWLCDRGYNKNQWRHIIAQVYDYAGHMYESNIYVFFCGATEYKPGYAYLFGSPYGPFTILSILDLALAIDQTSLSLILKELNEDATHVDFVAKQRFLKKEFTFTDDDLSDGCSCELDVPFGIYSIIAKVYDNDHLLEEHTIISKMLVLLI